MNFSFYERCGFVNSRLCKIITFPLTNLASLLTEKNLLNGFTLERTKREKLEFEEFWDFLLRLQKQQHGMVLNKSVIKSHIDRKKEKHQIVLVRKL